MREGHQGRPGPAAARGRPGHRPGDSLQGARADPAEHPRRPDGPACGQLLWNLRRAFPSVKLAWADGGYAGRLVTWARTKLKPRLTLQIVKRPGDLHIFQVLPRRWVVERTLAWITRCRRTVRDYERLPEHHETIVYRAMTITMSRWLARQQQPSQPLPSSPDP